MDSVYRVCIPHTHRDFFDYTAEDLRPVIGARVWVPFRTKRRLGIIVGEGLSKEGLSCKPIHSLVDEEAFLSEDLLNLCFWVSHYYQAPLSQVLPLAIPKKYRLGAQVQWPKEAVYQLQMPLEEAKKIISPKAKKQMELLLCLASYEPVSKNTLTLKGFEKRHLSSLMAKGLISQSWKEPEFEKAKHEVSAPLSLNPEQAVAVATIGEHLNHYKSFLLQGVTGSGKTEVYLQVIAKVLEAGKQVLVLVPEIGLTPQLLHRFTDRFSQAVNVIHSQLNETKRQIAWHQAFENKVQLVIGTRSAVFTRMPKLGLIIIDEEHDASLKQMEKVRYSARDTALMRAYLAKIPIILGSATPSLESLYNCQKNKYSLLRLNQKALSLVPLQYQLIDLRERHLKHGLCQQTLNVIGEHLHLGNQVLVFINRRGFAPVLLCHQCGWMADCAACDSHLTWHKSLARLMCHHCGLTRSLPSFCPQCKSQAFIPVGAGTQRVQEYLCEQFKDFEILRVDRDEVSKKNALERQLERIQSGDAKLIVGTQMLAKGHHFPCLSLVVVVDADAGLYNQDFRKLEQLGQLLIQVAGRAGRESTPGKVLIQTHSPNHPLLNVLIQQGYEAFAQDLLSSRLKTQLPPFYFLAMIRAKGKTVSPVLQFLQTCKRFLQEYPVHILGPAPAPLARKADLYHMQVFIKSSTRQALNTALTELRKALSTNKLSQGIRWNIDVDPLDLS